MSEENIEITAAKQLLVELTKIKNHVYNSGSGLNSILITQIKMAVRGLIKKYNEYDLFIGETIDVKLDSYKKYANFEFVFSPKLKSIIDEIKLTLENK